MNIPGVAFPHELMGYERDSVEGIGITVELISQYNIKQNEKNTLARQKAQTKQGKVPKGPGAQARARKISRGPQRSRMKNLPKKKK